MNLGKQIDSLLKRHSLVYVKGLGVFHRVYTPATFDSKRNVFLPPISFIEFDHFNTEGFDFLGYLQQVEQIDYTEAQFRLEQIIVKIIDEIHQHGEYTLENLGTLVSYGNSYVFKPLDLSGFLHATIENENVQVANVGDVSNDILPEEVLNEEIKSQDLADSVVETIVENTSLENHTEDLSVNVDEVVESNIEEIALETEIEDLVEKTEVLVEKNDVIEEPQKIEEEPKESSSYIYGLIAAIAVLVLGGIYYYATQKPNRTLVENIIPVVVPTIDTNQVELDTLTTSIEDTTNAVLLKQDSISTAETKSNVIVKPEPIVDYKYIIVIGTHKSLAQAKDEAEAYNKKGHKSVRVLQPNLSKNLKRVIWDTYPTREKRDSALREVRKHHKEDAWGAEI